jgi:hypothetical protein
MELWNTIDRFIGFQNTMVVRNSFMSWIMGDTI